jgi:hypothetical protein
VRADLRGRQLRVIEEIVGAAAPAGIEVWLRGGWAMDFYLGEVSRPHIDVDWFCWLADSQRLADALHKRGYADDPRVPPQLQLDLIKDGVEVSFAYLARNGEGHVVVGAGPWTGAHFPDRMLDGSTGQLAGITCPIISPAAQIELKEMYPVWMPGRPRRPKDADDIARLRDAMDRRADRPC